MQVFLLCIHAELENIGSLSLKPGASLCIDVSPSEHVTRTQITHTCMFAHNTHTHTHTRTRAHTHTNTQTPKHTQTHAHPCRTHTHMHTRNTHKRNTGATQIHTQNICAPAHACPHSQHTHAHTQAQKCSAHLHKIVFIQTAHSQNTQKQHTDTCNTQRLTHTRAQHTHARMHTRMHTSTCTCIHVMYATHTKKNKSAPLTFSTHIQTHTCARITSTYTCAHTQVDIYTRGYRHSLSFVAGKEACACLCSGACRAQALSDQQPLLFL